MFPCGDGTSSDSCYFLSQILTLEMRNYMLYVVFPLTEDILYFFYAVHTFCLGGCMKICKGSNENKESHRFKFQNDRKIFVETR